MDSVVTVNGDRVGYQYNAFGQPVIRRRNGTIGFVTPADMLAGRAEAIWAARDQKLEAARDRRRAAWHQRSTEHQQALTEVH